MNRVSACLAACLAVWIFGLAGCAHSKKADADAPPEHPLPIIKITSISFTGPGLDGVPTRERVVDNNPANFTDPQPEEQPLITAPEYIPAQLRSKPGFFKIGTQFHVKVAVTIQNLPAPVVSASIAAICPSHPELDLADQVLEPVRPGSSQYQAILQIAAPLDAIHIYDDFIWKWTISVNHQGHRDASNNTVIVGASSGTWSR